MRKTDENKHIKQAENRENSGKNTENYRKTKCEKNEQN